MSDEEAPRKPPKKRPRYSPEQRVSRCDRKIKGYLRQIDRMREEIDKQTALKTELSKQIEEVRQNRVVLASVKRMEKDKQDAIKKGLCGFQWTGFVTFPGRGDEKQTYTCTRPKGHLEEGYAGCHEDDEGHLETVSGKWRYHPDDPYDDGK